MEVFDMKKKITVILLALLMLFALMPSGVLAETEQDYEVTRIYGADRYETAFAASDMIYEKIGQQFDRIVVASGKDYPDALSAMMLMPKSPFILTSDATESKTLDYIHNRVKAGGQVCLIGGTGVVSQRLEDTLTKEGYEVIRLGGKDRYETNLEVVKTRVNVWAEYDLVICSGKNYADALSAGTATDNNAVLMIVDDKLTESQIQFFNTYPIGRVWILGGEGAVSKDVEKELAKFKPTRIAGRDRFETSALAAKQFSNSMTNSIVLAYGYDFADGLVAGTFSYLYTNDEVVRENPVILAAGPNQIPDALKTFVAGLQVEKLPVYVFGGPKLISDDTIAAIMSVE